MTGVRVSGISDNLEVEVAETELKIYFSKPCNGGGVVSKIYYPLLNNDAVVIFKDSRVADAVLTVSHKIRDMDLNVQALPPSVFVKIEATLNTEISALISATEKYQDYLKYSADLELKFDEGSDGWVLCGNWYQVEWAWNFTNAILEHQLSIHSNLLGYSNSSISESPSENNEIFPDRKWPGIGRSKQASGHSKLSARHVDGETKSVPKIKKKKMSQIDIRRSTSARVKDQNNKQILSEVRSKENETVPYLNLSVTPAYSSANQRTEVVKKGESDIDPTAKHSALRSNYPDLRTEVLKRSERSEPGSSPSSDSETGGISFCLNRHKSGIRHKKPRTERNASPNPRQADADGTFEEFSKLKVTENRPELGNNADVGHKSYERDQYENTEHETELKRSYSSDDQQDDHVLDLENNQSPRTALTRSATHYSLKRRSHSTVDSHKTNTELENVSDVNSEQTIRESDTRSQIKPESSLHLDGSNEYFKFNVGDIAVYIFCDDITKERTDAIVNAAMGTFINGAGVARAIARAASPTMQQECDRHLKQNGPLKTSEVVRTRAGGSLSKDVSCILHTVGPMWFDDNRERCFHELTQTFQNCFIYANKHWLKSISLPTISSGIFQVPLDICMLSFFEALLLFTSKPPTKTYLTEIHVVNNDPSVVLQCVDYLKIILRKDLDVSLARALERYSRYSNGRERNSKSYQVLSDEKIDYSGHARNGSRMSEKRPVERRSSSLSRAVRKKSFSESEWNGTSTANKKSNSHSSDAGVTSRSSGQPNFIRSQSFDANRSGPINKRRPQSADVNSLRVDGKSTDVDTSNYSHKSGTGSVDQQKNSSVSNTFKVDSRIKSSPPRLKQSLNTKSKSLKEKPRRIEDRETKSLHQPLKADISLGDATKYQTSHDDMFIAALNHRDYEFDQDLDGFQSLPPNIGSTDLKQRIFGRIDKESTIPENSEMETCPICLDKMSNPKTLTKCRHQFCEECIEEQFSRGKPVCPCCGMVYGIVKGDQPKEGKMTSVVQRNIHIPGFKDSTGAIVITYSIPSGHQEDHHPNPGRFYSGITRKAFLPYNKEGREIVQLLEKAFNAGLMFTIGQSRTTGSEGVVTWNDIHHKTCVDGGSQGFGYPDPTYLNRVREELAAKGITAP